VHVHNVAMGDFQRDYAFALCKTEPNSSRAGTFLGIVAPTDASPTRNYIGILTSVNCSATVARMIARHFENRLDDYPERRRRGGAHAQDRLRHGERGRGDRPPRRTIAGYARHPNFFSSQLVGLGCEANQINYLLSAQAEAPATSCDAFTIQEKGGTARRCENGIARVKEMLPRRTRSSASRSRRSHLTLGLQCGGSDGYSASARIPRSARRRPAGAATAARRSCRRRPRSTAPSTC
jgi:altronate hydrolase